MKKSAVIFDEQIQKLLIAEAQTAAHFQQLHLHACATDPAHAHAVVEWHHDRKFDAVCAQLRSSLTRRLNRELGKRAWFSENASRRIVKNDDHFIYLMETYLPDHRGWKWRKNIGLYLDKPSS